jgi:hypothetical protein
MNTLLFCTAMMLTPPPFAGGADSCLDPEPIAGQGTFDFDLSTASTGTEGQSETLCSVGGTSAIQNDVWFTWTAPSDGVARLYTCDQTVVDTKIAVYLGVGCPQPGTAVVCNDDTCGNQSTVQWTVVAGMDYTIQIGNAPGGSPGTGSFQLFVGGNAQTNVALAGTAIQSSMDFGGQASRGIDGNTSGIWPNGSCTHTLDAPNSWWEVSLAATAPISRVLLYNRLDCCHERLSNFRVSVFNGSTEVYGQDTYVGSGYVPANGIHEVLVPNWVSGDRVRVALLGLNNTGNGFLTLAEVEVLSESPTASFCFGDGSSLTCPCGNLGSAGGGCSNSTGSGAIVSSFGSSSLSAGDLGFAATGLIPGLPAILFQGNDVPAGGSGLVFGDGLRCAGTNIFRMGWMTVDPTGGAIWSQGLATQGQWASGDTRRFQVWYSDPSGSPCGMGFNTTNALELIIKP